MLVFCIILKDFLTLLVSLTSSPQTSPKLVALRHMNGMVDEGREAGLGEDGLVLSSPLLSSGCERVGPLATWVEGWLGKAFSLV